MLDISTLECSYYSSTLNIVFYYKNLSSLVNLQDYMLKKREKQIIKNAFMT